MNRKLQSTETINMYKEDKRKVLQPCFTDVKQACCLLLVACAININSRNQIAKQLRFYLFQQTQWQIRGQSKFMQIQSRAQCKARGGWCWGGHGTSWRGLAGAMQREAPPSSATANDSRDDHGTTIMLPSSQSGNTQSVSAYIHFSWSLSLNFDNQTENFPSEYDFNYNSN